ncbi:G-patch domain and KOW motifs-containing protein [Rhynchophorus ferrugineus]|uniref:G-patch domain and KOW motifs-containing protein n=1 Tax=Rhynchophorus ferrugineus TaxID=354439 RepID=UPI003FCD477E
MDSKKVSFGFNKLSKKPNIISAKAPIEEKKVELIDCLEGQSIKIKDAAEEEAFKPLVIPIKDNKKNLLDRIRDARLKQTVLKEEQEDTRPDSELTPEELAARELIKEAKKRLENGTTTDGNKISVLPLKSENLILEGEKEPTLEDYESIPVADFGLAILRGMGWKDGMPIGKNVSKTALVSVPELRPKGLGLGATKIIQSEKPKQNATDKAGKELTLVKGSYAKIIAGGEKGNYCVIQGFDEDAGRVIVKVHPKGNILNINEFMLVPVDKEEFLRGSKVLNNVKYEEYKEKSDKKLQKHKENSDIVGMKLPSGHQDKHNPIKSIKKYNSDDDPKKETISKINNKIKHERRSRSRSRSPKIKNKDEHSGSSDSEHYRKQKKSHKKSKSKSRNRSSSRDRYRKHKKQKSKSRRDSDSSDSDSDYRSSKKHHKYRSRNKSSSDEDSKSHRRK